MKNILVNIGLGVLFMAVSVRTYGQPEWQKKYRDPKVVQDMFASPPMFYAPHTFWFWDDTIKDEHFAASMVDEMAKQRLNPGYAHPRGTLRVYQTGSYPVLPREQYLEKPWFNSFGNAMQKAKAKGMTLGYCDEYNWPSGQAAGRVIEQHPELEAQHLVWKRYEVKGNSTVQYDSLDFAVAGKIVNKKIDASSLRLIGEGNHLKWKAPEGNWVVYTYTKTFLPESQRVRVNYLDSRLMDAFIPMVHEQYAKRYGNEMGKSIPGVFVDNEGDYGMEMAWSDYFAKRYKEIKKQDIRLRLPLLTEEDNDGLFAKARYDWFDVVSDVYNECFFKPVVNWLNKYNMYYISNLWEESLQAQAKSVGDYMRITRTATMPGTDCLQMKSQDVHDFKETQSVAEFEDRPFMSEIMGVAGWGQTPEMMKMTINSITSFGVNHVVPHGISLNRKIESIPYPADWFTENPYWSYMHYWTDFARRAAFVTRQSKLVADVLLINPQESVWAFSDDNFSSKPANKRAGEINRVYSDAMRVMNKSNIDFLIADKYYLNRGNVRSVNQSANISINDHEFSAIVLPSACIIPRASSNKILEFAKKGGVVVILGELPQGSTEKGLKDEVIINQMNDLKKLPGVVDLSGNKGGLDKLVTTLNEKIKPQIRLETSGRLYTAHRKIAGNHFYWFANNTTETRKFTASLRDGEGHAEIWDCETGKVRKVTSVKGNGYNKVSLTLNPYEGYWLVYNNNAGKMLEPLKQAQNSVKEIILDQKWTLSYPATDTIYKTTGKIEDTANKVINEEKLAPGYDDSGWRYFRNENHPIDRRDKVTKAPKYDTYIYWRTQIPAGSKSVVLPSRMVGTDIWIDGKKTHLNGTSLDLPANAGLLSSFRPSADLKLFLASPMKFVVGKKENIALKLWHNYGLQQFTGYVDYETNINVEKTGSPISIDLGKVKYMAEVFVNDKSVGARLWPPYAFDLSKELKQGDNKIRIRIGNLMVGDIWLKEDLGNLRTWGWDENPVFDQYDAGLAGPVKLLITN